MTNLLRHLWLALASVITLAHGQTLVTVAETGPQEERLNIVLLSEGYTSDELDSGKFTTDAEQISNALLTTEPFKSYRPYFNVYGIAVASAESGGDQGEAGTFVNTYFNSSFNSYGIDRLLTINSTGTARAYALLNTFVPQYDIVLVVVNDSKYGGSGGAIAVTSTNSLAPEIAIHEIGHSFGGLGDEYDYDGSQSHETPNTTQQTQRAFIKWKAWIDAPTPVPTPETGTYGGGVVGLFEGAAYQPTGWYRPTLNSKMKELQQPFYAVNEEALVLSIYGRISPITSVLPESSQVTVTQPNQMLNFAVNGPSTAATAPALAVQWWLDGVLIPGQTDRTLSLQSATLSNSVHTLQAIVHDPTAKVRKSTTLLDDSRTWTLNIAGQGPTAPDALSATVADDGSVSLTWEDKSSDEAAFAIERATSNGAFSEIARVAADETSYVDSTPAVAGNRYRVSGVSSVLDTVLGLPSNVATLNKVAITAQPASVTLIYGQTLTLSVAAKGTGTIHYQWRRDQQNLSGQTAATLVLADRQTSDAGSYDCVASNFFSSVTSKAAKLTVFGPPFISLPPPSQSVLRGQNAVFTTTAIGTAPLVYQWRRNGSPIAGATTSKLTLPSVKDSDVAGYDCVVSNGYGSTVSLAATLSLNASTSTNHKLLGQRAGLAKWQWVQRLGGTGYDSVGALAFAEGKLYAGGDSESISAKFGALSGGFLRGWTAGFNPSTGAAEWVRHVSNGFAYGVDTLVGTGDSSLLFGGLDGTFGRQSTTGTTDWTSNVSGQNDNRTTGIGCSADGSIFLTVEFRLGSRLVKASPTGTVLWQRNVTGSLTDLHVDAAGRILVTGCGLIDIPNTSFENASPNPPTLISDPVDHALGYIACYNADGNVQWAVLHGSKVESIAPGHDDSHVVCAVNQGDDAAPLAALLVLDSSTGAVTNEINAGAAQPFDAVEVSDGEYALLMQRGSAETRLINNFDLGGPGGIVAKYSTTGQLLWLLPVNGYPNENFSPARGRLITAPDGRLFAGFNFGSGVDVRFAGQPVLPMKSRDLDGFLASISETPVVTVPPASQILPLNSALHLTVTAEGRAGTITYQWYKDGHALKNKTQSTLDIAAAKATDAGSYHVRITASGGTTDSAKVPVNIVDTSPRALSAPHGKVLDLPVTATGTGLSYTWWRNGTRIFNTGGYSNSTTSKLRISAMSAAFADSYVCKVTGAGGMVEVPFTTSVMHTPVFTTPVVPGSVVSGFFELQLSASEAATYSVKNLPSGLTYDPKTGRISGRPSASASRVITVVATNAAGSSSPALIFVLNVNDLAAQARGGFQSRVARQPWNTGLGGFLGSTVNSNGTVTGSLRFAGANHPLTGRVDGNATTLGWTFHQRIGRSGKPALLLTLNSPLAQDGELTGSVALEAPAPETATVSGRQTVWSSTRPASAFVGTFNATLTLPPELVGIADIPQGPGTMKTIVTASTGLAAWSGKLSDNTGFSGSSYLWPDGSLPQWLSVYANFGSLLGTPVISGSQQTGSIEWTRNPKIGSPSWTAFPLTVSGVKTP